MAVRLAGGALLLLGVVLAALGLIGLLSLQLVVSDGGAALVLLIGVVCLVLGVLVWRGSRLATMVALVLLVALVVLQATALLSTPQREVEDLWRLALTAALALLLALAARAVPAGRRGDRRDRITG